MMKRFKKSIAVFLAFIMMAVMPAASVRADSEETEYMRIGLRYNSVNTKAELSSDSGFALASAGENIIIPTGTFFEDTEKITLELTDGVIEVKDPEGNVLASLKGDGTECITGGNFAADDDTIKYGTKTYRGGIVPFINSSGQMNIINYLSVDDYVRGVVHSEIGQSSHIEAIKAQAVAIRSYAVNNRNKHNSQGFDMCTTEHCQVYSGADSEYPSTNKAVDETLGELIYYNGKSVAAFYFANSGGHTENSEDAWTSKLGYLRGVKDEYSPDSSWTVKLSREKLNSAFSSKGLGTVESITINSVNDSGYVASITVKGSQKSLTYTKEAIRSSLGTTLKCRNFTFSTEGGSVSQGGSTIQGTAGSSQSGKKTYYGLSSSGKSVLGSEVSILSAGGRSTKSLSGLTVLSAGGKAVLSGVSDLIQGAEGSGDKKDETESVMTVTFSDDSDVLVINGKGNGHGVGMSQQGAQQMAKKGFTYKEILKYYYTGIEVK